MPTEIFTCIQSRGDAVPPYDATEPIALRFQIDELLFIDDSESPLDALVQWYSDGLSALLKLKRERGGA